jgi:hypothetical protein
MGINIDEELARLDAEVKKLTLIKERRNAVAALTNELFPATGNVAVVRVHKAVPVVVQSIRSIKPPNKREQIAEFAKDYLKEHGAKTTRALVAAIEEAGNAELLADRKNKVVAVSQALGDHKEIFGTDRMSGWFLVNTEPKSPLMDIASEVVNKKNGVNNLFTTSTDGR